MATVYVTFGRYIRDCWLIAPRSEVITSSGVARSGNLLGISYDNALEGSQVQIYCDTPIYAAALASGNVTPATGVYIPGGVATRIEVPLGSRVSVIDV